MKESTLNQLQKLSTTSILIAAYVGVIVAMYLFGEFNTDLIKSNDFIIGQATLRGVSVGHRVSNFYFIIIGAAAAVFFAYWVSSFLYKKGFRWRFEREFQVLLLLQLSLWIVTAFTPIVEFSEQIIHASIFLLLFIEVSSRWISWPYTESLGLQSLFLGFIGCSLLVENIFIATTFFILVFFILLYFQRISTFLLMLLAGLPVVFVLSLELGMIFNQRGVSGNFVFVFVIILLISILGWIAIWRKPSAEKLVFSIQAPLLILGVTLFSAYTFQIEQNSEIFESGNRFNSLMMMESYGKWPIIDFLSSHLISDYFCEWVYIRINGYSSTVEPMIYRAFGYGINVLVVYYFLKSCFNNTFGLIIFILFIPYFGFFVPLYYSFALLPVIFLVRFGRYHLRRDLVYFFLLATGLVFWRIDLGVATVFGAALTFLVILLLQRAYRKWILIIGGIGSLIYGGLLLLYTLKRKEVALQAKHYFGGNQAHGYDVLSYSDSNWFYIDYMILPSIVIFIMVYLLVRFKSLVANKLYYSLLFLGGFYFMNFQRGLVRHSFVEQNEAYVSSFGWLIIGMFILGFGIITISKKWIPALVIAGFLLSISGIQSWENIVDRSKTVSVTELPDFAHGKLNRVIENEAFNAEILPVINFLKKQTTKEQTFVDLSNSPMLYFYTNRAVPSVFMQYLQNTIDPFLQDENCKQLAKLDIPYVVFRQSPETFMDHTDGISNKVRYFRSTAYIYRHYKPMRTIGKFEVWQNKNLSNQDQIDSNYAHGAEVWELGLLPYYWVNEAEVDKKAVAFDEKQILLPKLKANNFLVMLIESSETDNVNLTMDNVYVSFQLVKGKHEYRIPVGVSYHLYNSRSPVLNYAKNSSVVISEMSIIELP